MTSARRLQAGPTAGLASPVWHQQGPAARYGRCRHLAGRA